MKKSEKAPACILVAVSASLVTAGCGSSVSEVRRCVDQDGFVLPDSYCGTTYYNGGSFYYFGSRRIVGRPVYVYGGGGYMSPGGMATQYRRYPTEGANITLSNGTSIGTYSNGTITRGGFGGSGGGGGSFGG